MKYHRALPQLNGTICLTDGGLETVLMFQRGIELPGFASFTILERDEGEALLLDYFADYIQVACKYGLGLLLESPTWRASAAWGHALGFDNAQLDAINHKAVQMLSTIRDRHETAETLMPISGCIGPRGAPSELGSQIAALKDIAPTLNVVGGCCGTDHEQIAEIASAITAQRGAAPTN